MPHVVEADPAFAPRATLVIPSAGDELMFFAGRSIAAEVGALGGALAVVCDEGEVALPDLFDGGLGPVASPALLGALARLGVDNVEDFATALEFDDGRVVATGHRALNVVGRVACVDLSRARHSRAFGRVFRVERLALRATPPDLRLWRPHEWPQVLLADDALAAGLRDAGLSGLRLTPADEWVNEDY